MAFDYDAAFKRIISKARILDERYKMLLESRNEALATIDELQGKLAARDKEIEQLTLKVEYLQLASTIAPSREQVEAARSMITSLVRDIDRCITDLSD